MSASERPTPPFVDARSYPPPPLYGGFDGWGDVEAPLDSEEMLAFSIDLTQECLEEED